MLCKDFTSLSECLDARFAIVSPLYVDNCCLTKRHPVFDTHRHSGTVSLFEVANPVLGPKISFGEVTGQPSNYPLAMGNDAFYVYPDERDVSGKKRRISPNQTVSIFSCFWLATSISCFSSIVLSHRLMSACGSTGSALRQCWLN